MENEYVNLIKEDKVASSSEPVNEYVDIIQGADEVDGADFRLNMREAVKKNPDQFASDLDLADEVGLPVDTVERNRNRVESLRKLRNPAYDKVFSDNKELSQFLSDKTNATLSQDDVENMSYYQRWIGDFKQSAKRGDLQTEVAEIPFLRLIADDLSSEERINLNRYKHLNNIDYDIGFVAGIPSATRETVPLFLEQAKDAVPYAAGGAAIGAGVGAASGSAAGGVGAIPGAIAGAKVGAVRGFSFGLTAEFGMAEASLSYIDIASLKDDNGKPIEKSIAVGGAVVVGVLNGVLERFGFDKVVDQFPAVGKKIKGYFGKEGVKVLLKRPVMREAFARLGGAVAKAGIAEGGTEALQEVNQIMVTEIAKEMSDADFSTFQGEDGESFIAGVFERAVDAGIKGAQGGIGLGSVSAGSAFAVDNVAISAANKRAEMMRNLGDAVQDSKLIKRAPKKFREWFSTVKKNNPDGVNEILIPAEKFSGYFQDKDISPIQIAEELGVSEQYAEAIAFGSDISIPIEVWAEKIAPTEHHEGLVNDTRFSPEEMSVNEINDLIQDQDEKARIFSQEITEIDEAINQSNSEQNVYDSVYQSLKDIGQNDKQAKAQASLYSAFFRTMAERTGRKADELFYEQRLKIRQRESFSPAPQRVSMDTNFIDRVRGYIETRRDNPKTRKVKGDRPMIREIRSRGGVKIGSQLDAELRARDINPRTFPGLFVKEGGIGDIDNIPRSELEESLGVTLEDDGNGYADRDNLFDIINEEISPVDTTEIVRSDFDQRAEDFVVYAEGLGIDFSTQSNEQIIETINRDQRDVSEFDQFREITNIDDFDVPFFQLPDNISTVFSDVAEQYNIPLEAMIRVAQIESGLDPNAKNPNSSASGLFQFIQSTAAQYNIDDVFDISQNSIGFAQLWNDNKNFLTKELGREPSAGELYLAHQQGAEGARRLLSDPNALAVDIVGKDAIELNGGNVNMTAQDFANLWVNKYNEGLPSQSDVFFQSNVASPVETPEFKEWFGDSEVVSENGDPLVMYHGTTKDFDSFDADFSNAGVAGWFSTSSDTASNHTKELRSRRLERELGEKFKDGGNIVPVYLSISNPKKVTKQDFKENSDRQVADIAKEQGHDGLILDGGNGDIVYVAFEPTQIKSVNNRGSFDRNDPRILFQDNDFSPIKQNEITFNGKDFDFKGQSKARTSEIYGNKSVSLDKKLMEEAENILEDDSFSDLPIQSIPVEKLVPTQKFIGIDNLEKVKDADINTNAFVVKDGENYFILDGHHRITSNVVKGETFINAHILSKDDNNTLFQQPNNPRGSFQQNAQGNRIIEIYENADESTFLHESGHFFLEVFRDISNGLDATDKISEDYKSLLDWLGVKEGEKIKTVHHEKFARGFEAYLYEGKAPSTNLESVFDLFRSWLVKVYKNIKNLNVSLSKDVRGVMDRMLATDEEIEISRNRTLFNPDPQVLEMLTEAEKKDYIAINEKARQSSKSRLLKKAMKEKSREGKNWWKEETERARERFEKEISSQPEYKAVSYAKEEKIDRKSVRDLIGKEGVDKLPNGILKSGGLDPQLVADLFGFGSVIEMVETFWNMPPLKEAVDIATERYMKEKYGDILTDGTISEKALEAAHNEAQEKNIEFELKTINSQIGDDRPIPRDVIKEQARIVIGRKKISQATRSSLYLNASIRHAKETGKFLAKKQYDKAATAKRKQLFNFYLYRESIAAREDVNRLEKYVKKFKNDGTRRNISKDFRDQIDGLLQRFELLSSDKLQQPKEDFRSFVDRQKDEGEVIDEPMILNESGSYKEKTIDGIRGLHDLIKSLQHIGREQKTIQIGLEKVTAKDAAENAADSISKIKKIKTPIIKSRTRNAQDIENKLQALGKMNGSLMRPEFIMKELDGGAVNGPLAQALLNPIAEAQKKSFVMQEDVFNKLEAIFKKNKNAKTWDRDVYDQHFQHVFSIRDIIAIALNMGNSQNKEKMMNGGMKTMSGRKVLFSEADLQRLTSHLKKSDWDSVQEIWNLFEELRPDLQRVYSDLTGLDMKVVQAQKLETPHGTYKGGYYPIVYDPEQSAKAARIPSDSVSVTDNDFEIPSVKKGMGKSRTNFVAPIKLDFDSTIRTHIINTVHLITHGAVVRDANRVLTNKKLSNTIIDRAGLSTYKNLRSWLVSVAKNSTYDHPNSDLAGIIRHMRNATTSIYLGFSIGTGIKQSLGVTATLASVARGEFSFKNFLKGYRSYLGDPSKVSEFVIENSNEMITRVKNLNSETATLSTQGPARNNLEAFRNAGVAMHGYTQVYSVDIPTWYGAYMDALEKNEGDHKQAVDFADAIVRQTQGGGNVKDLAAMQRASEAERAIFTMFGTYAVGVLFPKLREVMSDLKVKNPKKAAMTLLPLVVLPAVLEGILNKDTPEDDETYAEWIAMRSLIYGLGGIPFVGTATSGAIQGFEFQLSSVESVIRGIQRGLGSGDPEALTKGFILTVAFAFKLPIYKPYQNLEEIKQVATGQDEFSAREVILNAPDDENRR